jgi:hypothetical protein
MTIEWQTETRSRAKEHCQNCGVLITQPSAFCGNCGAALAPPPAPQTANSAGSAAPPPSASTPPMVQPPPAPIPQMQASPSSPPGQGPPPAAPPPATPQQPAGDSPKDSRNWIPYAAVGGAVVAIAALVAVLLLTLGGSAGKNLESAAVTRQQALQLLADSGTTTVSSAAPGLFAFVKVGKLTTIVPAGWRASAQNGSGTTRIQFTDPKRAGSALTIVAQDADGEDTHRQAAAAFKAVKKTGSKVGSYGSVTLPGGRAAWQVTYLKAGMTNETYFFSACSGKAAMVVDVAEPAAIFTREQATLQAVADSVEPACS